MNAEERSAALDKFPRLQPKGSFDKNIGISEVHISKNWKLPPRLKPGRRPQAKAKKLDEEEYTIPEEEDKKKQQNRDAQRAYRERRTNRLQELEGMVNSLQNVVKRWKRKYKDLEMELEDVKKDNSYLKSRMKKPGLKACNDCFKDSHTCICHDDSDSITLQDPFLQNAVKNFKPLKAVSLKRHKPNPLKLLPESSSAAVQEELITPVTSGGCGFCSDDTPCMCRDLGENTRTDESSIITMFGRCSSNVQGQCWDCADIDKSCLGAQSASTPTPVEVTPKTTCSGWKPGTCEHCRSNPESKAFCQSICNSAAVMAAMNNDDQEDCSSNLTAEPGSCLRCQTDPQRRLFCQTVLSKGPNRHNSNNEMDADFVPVSLAYQRVKNHMIVGNLNVQSNQLPPPMRKIAYGLKVRNRVVESKSIDDAIRDMDKNALG